jgi:Glycosyl transferase family 2
MRAMKIIGLLPVRNEDWCLGLTMRVALQWCDELVVLDHASTDDSCRIEMDVAGEHPGRVTLMRDEDPIWNEMAHRQTMLEMARRRGATHIAIVDADEFLTANVVCGIRGLIRSAPGGSILQIPLYNVRGSLWAYHASGMWSNRITSIAFEDVAAAKWSGDRFHSREPLSNYISRRPLKQSDGGVIHLWGMRERRLRAKHALYKVTERLRWPTKSVAAISAMYSQAVYGNPGDGPREWKYADTPLEWLDPSRYAEAFAAETLRGELISLYLRAETVPWQEREVQDIVRADPERFAGLDLFGIA